MSTNPSLTPAGSATYQSNSMYVGDGTWDSSRNTFLLPNLVGLNFATMQYNGMKNRFSTLPQYHRLILAHGIIAAITFLGVVPLAIFIARFYHKNPRRALRMHIWLQILTVLLTTVIFVLGYQAVGPARKFTNPHHGIGLAIFILVLVQALGGWFVHHTEKGKERYKIPLRLMFHQWLGRGIALLGLAQIPLGLTLYGSPVALFILYALWVFFLLLLYFVLEYRHQPTGQVFYDADGSSYVTEGRTEHSRRSGRSHRHRPGLGALAAGGAAAAGIAALRHRSRSRSRDRSRRSGRTSGRPGESGVMSRHSRYDGDESVYDEKVEQTPRKEHKGRNRLLGGIAGLGALAAARKLFNRRDREKEDRRVGGGGYVQPSEGRHSVSETDLSRLEEGRPPISPNNDWQRVERMEAAQASGGRLPAPVTVPMTPTRPPRRSGGSLESLESYSDDEGHGRPSGRLGGWKQDVAALGVAGFLGSLFKRGRDRKEERRVDEQRRHDRIENERINRANSRRYTGDGAIPPPRRRRGSQTDDELMSETTYGRPGIPAMPTSAVPSGSRADLGTTIPPPPASTIVSGPGLAVPETAANIHESGSEAYLSPGGRQHRRHHRDNSIGAGAVPAAALAGAALQDDRDRRRRDRRQRRHRDSSSSATNTTDANTAANADPNRVSVKVKMHDGGRSVTLRRLNEEEAAAARRGRRRSDSASSLAGPSGSNDRWRRVEQMEAAQAAANQSQATITQIPPPPMGQPIPMPVAGVPAPPPIPAPPPHLNPSITPSPSRRPLDPAEMHLPPPPPIPASGSIMSGGVSSPPGTLTATDVSNYDSNRRRRRAERARQAGLRGPGASGTGSRVEFT